MGAAIKYRSVGTGNPHHPVPTSGMETKWKHFDENSPLEEKEAMQLVEKVWSHPPESNRRPTDYESVALPTELGWLTWV